MVKDKKTSKLMFKTHNDLDAKIRQSMVEQLNQQLADSFDLYSQTKQAHWNVKGMHFRSLHLLFDDLAEHLEHQIDEIAERATALGGKALGTARMAVQNSRLPEYPDVVEGQDHLQALVERYAAHAQCTREAIDQADEQGDADTADLLTDISRQLDKDLWFLEAHLMGED